MQIKKRIVPLIIITILLTHFAICHASASSHEYTEDDKIINNTPDYSLDDLLSESGTSTSDIIDNNHSQMIISLITRSFSDNAPLITQQISTLAIIIITLSLFTHTFLHHKAKTRSIILILSTIQIIITITPDIILTTTDIINNITNLLSIINPSIVAASLSSGATFSATTATVSLTLILTIFEQIATTILFPFTVLITTLFITENIYPPFSSLGTTKALKKNLTSTLIFSFSFLLALVTFNGSLAASKDSAALRGIKFATANVIPLIGASVSESMKTLIAGAAQLKNSIGITSSYALLAIVLPGMIKIFIQKLSFRLASTCATLLGVNEASSVLDGASDIIDIFLAILTAITVVAFFSIFLFTNSFFL